MFAMIGYLVTTGVGVWGNNQPVGWGWAIVNFVFWVGIGHAGTLISAILFLFRQNWRTSINRFAEAMTIFAVDLRRHVPGHPRRAGSGSRYWLFPMPNQMGMWPNFRCPLLWDVFAVSTYATVSLLFWYVGMIPDLATLRDRARASCRQFVYGIFALGWRGCNRHWHHYEMAYLLLAGAGHAAGAVGALGRVASTSPSAQLPGWHTTIFPPYFVAGAIFAGFAMVLTLLMPARQWFGLKDLITHAAPREHEQDHPGHRHDGRLRLRDGVLHRLVRRQPVREVRLHQPRLRPLRLGLLDHDHLQRARAAALLVQEAAHEHPGRCS